MYPQYMFLANMKIVKTFQLKIVIFTAVKNRCLLHGRVFVMESLDGGLSGILLALKKHLITGTLSMIFYLNDRRVLMFHYTFMRMTIKRDFFFYTYSL